MHTNYSYLFKIPHWTLASRDAARSVGVILQITDVSLEALGKNSKKLETLTLQGCERITDKGCQVLLQGCRSLTSLNLRGVTGLTEASVRGTTEIGRGLFNLELSSYYYSRDYPAVAWRLVLPMFRSFHAVS